VHDHRKKLGALGARFQEHNFLLRERDGRWDPRETCSAANVNNWLREFYKLKRSQTVEEMLPHQFVYGSGTRQVRALVLLEQYFAEVNQLGGDGRWVTDAKRTEPGF
jgi:hypothetical protein